MTDNTSPLSPRHERFVAEYLRDGNATQAYIRAGYSLRGAQPSASKLLRDPRIEAAVAAGRQRMAQALEVTVERIAQEYAKIAFANVADFISVDPDGGLRVDLEKSSQAQQAGILELKISNHRNPEKQQVTLKLGKLQALNALVKQLGVLVRKPAPGLTAEDRQRYEEKCEAYKRSLDHRDEEYRRLQRQLDETRAALEVAKQAQTVAAVEEKSEQVVQEVEQPAATPPVDSLAPVREPDRTLPQGTWVKRKPGEHIQIGPTSAEALKAMKPGGFPGR